MITKSSSCCHVSEIGSGTMLQVMQSAGAASQRQQKHLPLWRDPEPIAAVLAGWFGHITPLPEHEQQASRYYRNAGFPRFNMNTQRERRTCV
jgi:hypothetical protein